MSVFITTQPVRISRAGHQHETIPAGTEVSGALGEALFRRGRARRKPVRFPPETKPDAPQETKQ